jgi:5'-3' exonuclease
MKIHLVDGTYELFRHHFGAPPKKAPDGREVGATVGLLRSMYALVTTAGITHIGVAFDHVIESFRNDLYSGYKTSQGVDPLLLAQFTLAEEATAALGIAIWPMVEFEADDALATATRLYKAQSPVDQIVICSPDKDLAQLVAGERVVCWDRRREILLDEAGVLEKYGVPPESIPDWLALVGDAADGYPGITGWGAKSAAAVLSKYKHLESIPDDPAKWEAGGVSPGRATRLAEALAAGREEVGLYRRLATLREDVPLKEKLGDLEWKGARPRLKEVCRELGEENLPRRVQRWRED